jgi:thiamine biosynthesis lipoprotein
VVNQVVNRMVRQAVRIAFEVVLTTAALLVVVFTLGCGTSEQLTPHEYKARHMGVVGRVVLYTETEQAARSAAAAAFTRIAELEDIFSNYRPDSEVGRLQKSRAGTPVVVSADLMTVLQRSDVLWETSEGAFDPTVGPIADLWRAARVRNVIPERRAIESTRSRTGWQYVRIDSSNHSVTLVREGMSLDFGGIAKGYAADEALRVLRTHHVPRALVELGGDIVVGDPPPGEVGWRIDGAAFGAVDELVVANKGVSTSGDSQQYVEINGVRYSHIIDPRTGIGVTAGSVVTVVADDGLTSDGLATTISVLGKDAGLELARLRFLAARVFVRRDTGR